MEMDFYAEGLGELNKKYKEMDAIYHNLALRFGLSDTSFWILYILSETEEAITQYDLCNDWNYSKQTVNSAIASLERAGYVVKKQTFDARNRKILALTEEGKAFVRRTVERVKAAELNALRGLSCEEFTELLRLNEKYLQLFRKETNN